MAANYALLVGVSDYDESIGLSDLRAPPNDVALMQEVLAAHDFKVTLLSDRAPGGKRPSRNAILGAIDDLTKRAEAHDFIYLHFSGLGSQQPDANGNGMVNVFLPNDTARAATGSGEIPNAILEDEINTQVISMRAKGADVWFVRDSCHSSPSLHVGSPRVALRCVDPKDLGVEKIKISTKPAVAKTSLSTNVPGRYLTFFAAQPMELAREIQIDKTDPASWYGLLTSRLASHLQSGPAVSYRQLFQAIVSDLDDPALPGAARLQNPRWEGNLIDAAPFGGNGTVGPRQYPVNGDRLQAGRLQGLRDNMIVALVSNAGAGPDEIHGYAQLFQTGVRSARLLGVTGPCTARVSAPCSSIGPVVDGASFARVIATPLDPIVRIAPPVDLTTGLPLDPAHPLHTVLAQAIPGSNAKDGMAFSLEPDARILSGALDGELWFGERLSFGTIPMGLRWSPQDGPIEFVLRRIALAEKLASVLTNLSDRAPSLAPSPVDVQVTQRTADTIRPAQEAPSAESITVLQNPEASPAPSSAVQDKECYALMFNAQVTREGPALDVNCIYIDSQYCVTASHQRLEVKTQPVVLDTPISLCSDCADGDAIVRKAGAERMFILVSEPTAGSDALNLEGIVDTCRSEDAAAIPNGKLRKVDNFLAGLTQQDATRSNLESTGVSRLWVEAFRWQVLPGGHALLLADK